MINALWTKSGLDKATWAEMNGSIWQKYCLSTDSYTVAAREIVVVGTRQAAAYKDGASR